MRDAPSPRATAATVSVPRPLKLRTGVSVSTFSVTEHPSARPSGAHGGAGVSRKAGSIYGVMLTAWGVGGIIGPILIARVKDLTGNYTAALYIIAAIMLVSFLLPFFIRPPKVQTEAEAPVVGGMQPQAGD